MPTFWAQAPLLTRLALSLAGGALLVHCATYFGLRADRMVGASLLIHLAVMALFMGMFALTIYHHWLVLRRPQLSAPHRRRLPRPLLRLTFITTLYGLILFFLLFSQYGEGGPQAVDGGYAWVRDGRIVRPMTSGQYHDYQVASLRLFSSWWIFFSLIIGCVAFSLAGRIASLKNGSTGGSAA